MSAIDLIILLVAAVGLLYGWVKGLFTQLGSVGGVIVGIIVCRMFANPLGAKLAGADATDGEAMLYAILANAILFLAAFLLVKVVARFARNVTHALSLGVVDRLAGALFALLEWTFFLSLAINVWIAIKPDSSMLTNSKLFGGKVAELVTDFAPKVIGSPLARSIEWTIGVID